MTSKININESHLALISRRTAVTSSRHSPSKISYESVASVIHECVCSACEAEFIAVVLRIASDHVSSFRGIERLTKLIRPEFRNLLAPLAPDWGAQRGSARNHALARRVDY